MRKEYFTVSKNRMGDLIASKLLLRDLNSIYLTKL